MNASQINQIETKAECIEWIKALKQRIKDIQGGREFYVEEDYCVGGAEEPYYLAEKDALALLRNELKASEPAFEVQSVTYEKLAESYGNGGWFDVTRRGCQPSRIKVEPVG